MPPDNGYYGTRDRKEQDIQNLQAELRKVRDTLASLTSQNVDMSGRRTINAKHSRHDHDYIIKAELNNAVEQVKKIIFQETKPPVKIDLGQFVLTYDVNRLNYGSLSLTDIVITKDGEVANIADVPISGIYVVAACIDETRLEDTQNEILIAAIPNLQNEITFTVVGIAPTGWVVGDYIVINNRSIGITSSCSFEILKITAIVGPLVTAVRDGSDASEFFSWFGTPKSFHFGNLYAYKVDVLNFPFEFKSNVLYNPSSKTGFAERADLVIPNVCVVGVAAALYNEDGFGRWTENLLSTGYLFANPWESGDSDSRCPGLRTLNGAAGYILTTGTLVSGTESDFTYRPNETMPVRCLWGYLGTAAETTGSTDPVVTVEIIEINEATLVETVIEEIEFYTGEIVSGNTSYAPETRQLPYNPKPDLIGDNASNNWPVPLLRADRRYKTKITAIGADVAGANLAIVLSS
jgi:hypothetical protein